MSCTDPQCATQRGQLEAIAEVARAELQAHQEALRLVMGQAEGSAVLLATIDRVAHALLARGF